MNSISASVSSCESALVSPAIGADGTEQVEERANTLYSGAYGLVSIESTV